jgi:retron-type reverse transcriptase
MFIFRDKRFTTIISLTAKVLCLIARLLITLSDTIILLTIELYRLVEPLIKKFLILITCRVKTHFVLKRCSSDILAYQDCMINRFEYGVQIRSIHANFFFIKENIASKKQVENNFLNTVIVDKPFLVSKYVISSSFGSLKMRKRCNGNTPVCLLMDSFVRTKLLAREFSSIAEIESERLKRSILEDLKGEIWPTDCIKQSKFIHDYVQSIQNQILFCKREQQLDFLACHVFDIRNRIFSIDKVFNKSKSSSYNQVGYSDLNLKSHKFILLEQTKLMNLSELPSCKIVKVEIPKTNGGKRSLGISMPIDKVLQQMFLNYLDVLIEEKLKPEVFAYRKGRDARMAVASVYTKLNRIKYLKQMCLCSVDIEKCFDNFCHHQIVEQYPFPKSYAFLLFRWLTPKLIDKNHDFKNLGKVSLGVSQDSIIGPSITNLLLSNAFPKNILKEKGNNNRQKVWAEIFSYVDDIVLIANNQIIFFRHLIQLRKNLKKIGLSFSNEKTKSFVRINSKIKFQFLGFEFIVMRRHQLGKSQLFSNTEHFHSLKKGQKDFGVILRPSPEKVKGIKKRLKIIIKRILHQPRKEIYKSFDLINSTLLGWGAYYYFSQGCIYGKRIDNYVFKYLRKTLVKKFRYNGLIITK